MNTSLHSPSGSDPGQGGGPAPQERPGHHAAADDAAAGSLPQGLLLLTASAFCIFAGLGFVTQAEAVLYSPLGYALLTGGGYANAAGAVLLIAGAYWLVAAVRLFGGAQKKPLAPRGYVGGNALLLLGVLCFASAVGRGHFAADPAGGVEAPVLGTMVMAAGLYWLWTAAKLLGGDGRPAADLPNFVAGHVMLAAGVAGFSAVGALFSLDRVPATAAGILIFVPALFWFLTALQRLRGKPAPSMIRFVLGNALVVAGLASALWKLPAIYHADRFIQLLFDLTIWGVYVYGGGFVMMAGFLIATWQADQQKQIAELLADLRKQKSAG